jgi:dsDNA-specific endonuclease/ATPase MutS2
MKLNDTPRTDANCFSATTEKPSTGDYELEVVYADFARGLEQELQAFARWKEDKAELVRELAHIVRVQESCAHDFTEEDWVRIRTILAKHKEEK